MDKTALYKLSYGLYVVGTQKDGKFGGCIVDAFMQSTDTPPTVILCGIKKNQTNEILKETGEFTVSVIRSDADPFVIGNFGFQSGRVADKWANVPHKIIDGLPVLENAAAYLRCKVTDFRDLSTHTAFFCDVIDAWQGEGEPIIYGDYQKNMRSQAFTAFKEFQASGKPPAPKAGTPAAKKWVCKVCGYVYDDPTPFEDLPADWKCPLCAHSKEDFVAEV